MTTIFFHFISFGVSDYPVHFPSLSCLTLWFILITLGFAIVRFIFVLSLTAYSVCEWCCCRWATPYSLKNIKIFVDKPSWTWPGSCINCCLIMLKPYHHPISNGYLYVLFGLFVSYSYMCVLQNCYQCIRLMSKNSSLWSAVAICVNWFPSFFRCNCW